MWSSQFKHWARSKSRTSSQRRLLNRRVQYQVEALEKRMMLAHGVLDFHAPVEIALPERPDSVAVADFNLDGHLDIASAVGRTGVSVAIGNSDGTFSEPEFFDVTPLLESRYLMSGDFNHDGKPDLVVSHFGDNTVSVILNETTEGGDLAFLRLPKFFMGEESAFVSVGDFDGDGNLDLATANIAAAPAQSVGIALGKGDGTFGEVSFVAAGTNPNSLAVGDLNGDEILDLAITYSSNRPFPSANSVGVLIGNGDSTFRTVKFFDVGETPSSVVLSDFDRDGDLDIAVSNFNSHDVSILLNYGSGEFDTKGKGSYDVGLNPISLVAADFNGDGNLDIALASFGTNSVSVLLGNGNGTFRPAHRQPVIFDLTGAPDIKTIGIGDFDEDDRTDLAVPVVYDGGTGAVDVFLHETDDRGQRRGAGHGCIHLA